MCLSTVLVIMLLPLIVMCAVFLGSTRALPDPEPGPSSLVHPNPQNLEGVIASIEERLRTLDNNYALRFAAPRWELNMETHNRKLEALETKLARIETILEIRVDKLSENLSSKSMKEDLSKEQLNRKIDEIYERLNHRMSYMESRIGNNIAKFQSSLDATLTRTSNQLEHLEKLGSDLENDIMEVGTAVDDSKAVLLLFNQTNRFINGTTDSELAANVTDKIFAVYEETAARNKIIEEMTRKSLDLVNATRRELQDGIRVVKAAANRRPTCPTLNDGNLDYLIEKVDGMGRKNEGYYQKLDTTIQRLHMRQELYQESCHRLQLAEPQIETRISEILEKIWDSLENRTYATDKKYDTLMEGLKSHHSSVVRTVGHTTNTVMKLSQQMSHDVKSLYTNHPATEKIDNIILSLQELQDEFQQLNATITANVTLSHTLLNNTATILETIQNLNENMTTIIDKLSDYYRNIADGFEPESSDVSTQILQIFNMTEADLPRGFLPENTTRIPDPKPILPANATQHTPRTD